MIIDDISNLWRAIFPDQRKNRELIATGFSIIKNPADEIIKEALEAVPHKFGIAILADTTDSDKRTFMAASFFKGQGFEIQYQEGSIDKCYVVNGKDFPLNEVSKAFLCYVRGDTSWKKLFRWEKNKLTEKRDRDGNKLMDQRIYKTALAWQWETKETPEEFWKRQWKDIPLEEIVLSDKYSSDEKFIALTKVFNYSNQEAMELLKTAVSEKKRAKLKAAKGLIAKKAFELYGTIPTDDGRQPIPDEVKMYVWQRDKGKCVKCGSQNNIEYDHIIPFSKGGSNTARNIQILCQECNRSKTNKII